jgi:hypothetical protein
MILEITNENYVAIIVWERSAMSEQEQEENAEGKDSSNVRNMKRRRRRRRRNIEMQTDGV